MSTNINANKLAIVKDALKTKGMLVIKSEKTKNTSIQLLSKRDFTKSWLAEQAKGLHRDEKGDLLPKKQAARDFEAYRQVELDAFNVQVGTNFLNGNLRAQSIKADANGEMRNITLQRADRKKQDADRASLKRLADSRGISVDALEAIIKAHAPKPVLDAENDVIEIDTSKTTPVEDKSQPNQSAPSVGEAVAAAQ